MPKLSADENPVKTAMQKVDQVEQHIDNAIDIADTIAKAIDAPAPVYTTHSHGVDALFAAQEISLKAIVADIDAKIAALQAERTDAMLAYSMLSAGRMAKETNR